MLARRLPASLRHYATRTAVAAPKQTSNPPQPSQTPTPPPKSLKERFKKANQYLAETRTRRPQLTLRKGASPEEEAKHMKKVTDYRDKVKRQGFTPPRIILPLLDLIIPYAVGFKTRAEYPSVRAMYHQFVQNRRNDGKNAFSMRHIGVSDSFPGIRIDSSLGWFRSTYLFARRVFQAQSLKSTAWIAPMRQEMLEQYIKLNTGLLQASPRVMELTMKPYTEEVTALREARMKDGHLYRWAFHREVTPTRILSLRAGDGDFGKEMPVTGSRVAVQALVRFDTEQSLEIYDKQGRALHTPAPTAEPQPARLSKTLHIVPAERKRVTEYLVLDKAYYEPNAEWQFRARFVPTPGRTVAI
ncbi:hypothetical protein C8R44DRAFT_884622 [Mycena epipterygia]|nr:hypothetical protein C8R44DRAFT_884622 [Mycena epipterygia]